MGTKAKSVTDVTLYSYAIASTGTADMLGVFGEKGVLIPYVVRMPESERYTGIP